MKNNSCVREISFGGKIWCVVACEEEKCKYSFFPANIPAELGGSEEECVCGEIICDSPEAAWECATAISQLIKNGYCENFCWTYALDMNDVISNIFCGEPMKHLHVASASTPDKSTLRRIKRAVDGTSLVFCSFLVPSVRSSALSKGELALEDILLERDAEVWWQRSITDSSDSLDLWYR